MASPSWPPEGPRRVGPLGLFALGYPQLATRSIQLSDYLIRSCADRLSCANTQFTTAAATSIATAITPSAAENSPNVSVSPAIPLRHHQSLVHEETVEEEDDVLVDVDGLSDSEETPLTPTVPTAGLSPARVQLLLANEQRAMGTGVGGRWLFAAPPTSSILPPYPAASVPTTIDRHHGAMMGEDQGHGGGTRVCAQETVDFEMVSGRVDGVGASALALTTSSVNGRGRGRGGRKGHVAPPPGCCQSAAVVTPFPRSLPPLPHAGSHMFFSPHSCSARPFQSFRTPSNHHLAVDLSTSTGTSPIQRSTAFHQCCLRGEYRVHFPTRTMYNHPHTTLTPIVLWSGMGALRCSLSPVLL